MRRFVAALLIAGCSSGPTIRVEEPLRPDVRLMPDPDPGPGLIRGAAAVNVVDQALRKRDADLRLVTTGKDGSEVVVGDGAQEKDPRLVIGEGERAGTEDVIEGDCPDGACIYEYHHGRTYALHTCFQEDTLLQLAPGERLNDDRARGDVSNPKRCAMPIAPGWCASMTESGDGKSAIVQNLIVWQTTQAPRTKRAWLATNYGLYRFELHAAAPGEERCMGHVRFFHRDLEVRRSMAKVEREADVESSGGEASGAPMLSAQYTIEVLKGAPAWVPTSVVARMQGDRAEVAIQFPQGVTWSRKPAIMTDGGTSACRWVPETHVYVCDSLFHTAVIQMGSEESGYEKVRIRKAKE